MMATNAAIVFAFAPVSVVMLVSENLRVHDTAVLPQMRLATAGHRL